MKSNVISKEEADDVEERKKNYVEVSIMEKNVASVINTLLYVPRGMYYV